MLPKLRGGFYEPSYVIFKDFPIYVPDNTNPSDLARRDRIVALVEDLLAMKRALAGGVSPEERSRLEAACARADAEIDRIVYELYGLTDEEMAAAEGG